MSDDKKQRGRPRQFEDGKMYGFYLSTDDSQIVDDYRAWKRLPNRSHAMRRILQGAKEEMNGAG